MSSERRATLIAGAAEWRRLVARRRLWPAPQLAVPGDRCGAGRGPPARDATAISAPSSKMRTSSAMLCTSTDALAGACRARCRDCRRRETMPSWVTRRSSCSTASKRPGRQRLQAGLLLGEVLGDDAPRWWRARARLATVSSHCRELGVEVVEVAEAAGRGRSPRGCSGTAARPCPWSWPGRAGRRAAGSRSAGPASTQRAVVDDVAVVVLADHRGLHAVVEDLASARRRSPRRPRCGSAAPSAGPGAATNRAHSIAAVAEHHARTARRCAARRARR